MKRRLVAYSMLSVALTATVFCYALLQGIAGSQIAGASTQRRYFTLGVAMNRGVDYQLDARLVDDLMQQLPRSFAIAGGFTIPTAYSTLALPDGAKRIDVAVNEVSGQYFKAVDLPNVLGRVVTPAQAHAHEPEIVINRRCAEALFGSTQAALNRVLVLHVVGKPEVSLHVVGVTADDFTGIRASESYLLRHAPMAWVASQERLFEPALLSVPSDLAACRTYPRSSAKIVHPRARPMACADFD